MIREAYFISTLRGGVIHTILLIQAITISFNTLKVLSNIKLCLLYLIVKSYISLIPATHTVLMSVSLLFSA